MAIIVKHSGNAAPAAVAAFAGGQGKRQAEDARQAAALATRSREGNRGRKHAAEQADQQREFQTARDAKQRANLLADRKQQREQQVADEKRRREQQVADREGMAKREDEIAERNRDWAGEDADAGIDRQKDFIQWELSEKQKQQYDRLSESYQNAVDTGDFTDEELKEIRKEVHRQQLGIQPLPRTKKTAYPEGQGVGETWSSDDGGVLLTRNSAGDVKKVADTNNGQPTNKDRIDAWKTAVELSKNPETAAIDMDKARQLQREILGGGDSAGDSTAAGGGDRREVLDPDVLNPYTRTGMVTLMNTAGLKPGTPQRRKVATKIGKLRSDLDKAKTPSERAMAYSRLRSWVETLEGLTLENKGM